MEESEDPFAQGMQMIYKQLMTSLEEAGVKAIESVGRNLIQISTMPLCM